MTVKQLADAADALLKLLAYGYLPARQVFYLSKRRRELLGEIEAYHDARNAMLRQYGKSDDEKSYTIVGADSIATYEKELEALGSHEVEADFDPRQIVLCLEDIEKCDEKLAPEKRLGFTAADWEAIAPLCKVRETREE